MHGTGSLGICVHRAWHQAASAAFDTMQQQDPNHLGNFGALLQRVFEFKKVGFFWADLNHPSKANAR